MAINEFDFRYVPILKCKRGEQMTLRRADSADREVMLPLIEMIAKGSTSDDMKAAIYVARDTLLKAEGDLYPTAIDPRWCSDSPMRLVKILAAALTHLQSKKLKVWPVVTPMMLEAVSSDWESLATQPNVVLRIAMGSFLSSQLDAMVKRAIDIFGAKVRLHVVLDMEDITGGNVDGLVIKSSAYCAAAKSAPKVRSVVLAGGSFPFNLVGIKKGLVSIPRVEWCVWEKVRNLPGQIDLRFGDYAVTNPKPMEEVDPTKLNPAVAIRYAQSDRWLLFKGAGWKGPQGKGEYNNLCKLLIADNCYSGSSFSYGDKSYFDHAQPTAKSGGNPYVWRRDATSHHVILTARTCAKMFAI